MHEHAVGHGGSGNFAMPVVAEAELLRQLVERRKLIRREALHNLFDVLVVHDTQTWLQVIGVVTRETIVADGHRIGRPAGIVG